MSKFLAPIHDIMYGKIKNQDKINRELINSFGDENLLIELNENIGLLKEGELSEVIDLQNIHGWLQSQIDIVESGFSFIVNKLIENGVSKEDLINWFENQGKTQLSANLGKDIYVRFTDYFLDGMPCDRAIQPIELEDTQAKWVQNIDVHGKYWKDNGKLYNELRCAWLRGLSENNGFEFEFKDGIYEVKK